MGYITIWGVFEYGITNAPIVVMNFINLSNQRVKKNNQLSNKHL